MREKVASLPPDLQNLIQERFQQKLREHQERPEGAILRRGISVWDASCEDLWETAEEPLSFDKFSLAVDGASLFPYQLKKFQEAGIMEPRCIIDPLRKIQELLLLWGKGCMAGETMLTCHRTHQTMTMREWEQDGSPLLVRSVVGGSRGLADTSPVYLKGESPILRVTLEDGTVFRCTPQHRCYVFPECQWKELSQVREWHRLFTAYGPLRVVRIEDDGIEPFYDLSVPATACYFDDQGVLHHNSGKDWLSARFIGWLSYVVMSLKGRPEVWFNLLPGSKLFIINTAPTEYLAQSVFFEQYLVPVINSELFKRWREQLGFDIRRSPNHSISFPSRSLQLDSMNSSTSALEGRNLLAWVMDEADDFLDNENKSTADKIHKLFRSSSNTRFNNRWIGMAITYTRTEDGFAMREKEWAETEGEGYFVDVASTYEVNPKVTRNDKGIADDYRRDPVGSMARYECKPQATTDAFIQFSERIDECIDKTLKPCVEWDTEVVTVELQGGDVVERIGLRLLELPRRNPGCPYFLGGDAGKTHDSFALSIWHIEEENRDPEWLCPLCGGDEMLRFGDWERMPEGFRAEAACRECSDTTFGHPLSPNTRHNAGGWWRERVAEISRIVTSGERTMRLPLIVEDLLIEIKPQVATTPGGKNRTPDYGSIKEALKVLIPRMNIVQARFDPWQTEMLTQALQDELHADVGEISFQNGPQLQRATVFRTLLYEHALKMLSNEKARTELRRLQLIRGMRVDHPPNGGSKDLADARFIAVYLAVKHTLSITELEMLGLETPRRAA